MRCVSLVVVVASLLLAGSTIAAFVSNTPPRGWDSYDSNPIWTNKSIDEKAFLQQAAAVAYYQNPDGQATFPYVVIDEGWAESAEFGWLVDSFGRPTINPVLFPSSADGNGFYKLSQTLQSMGLQLGLWMIKGIPKIAVEMNLPVFGSTFKARDIFINKTCPWHQDVYYVNGSHPGGQAYYNSLVSLYNGWGATYLKMDCVFGQDLDGPEIAAMATALATVTSNPVLLSLSPGQDATPAMASKYAVGKANAYRITNDVWDCFSYLDTTKATPCIGGHSIINTTQTIIQFALAGLLADSSASNERYYPGPSFPDPDMLAFGFIQLAVPRRSQFTHANERYIYGLWTMTQSPIILGGSVSSYSFETMNMLKANMAYEAHQYTNAPMLLSYQTVNVTDPAATGFTAWQSNHSVILGAFFVGYFPYASNPAVAPANSTFNIPVAWPSTSDVFPEFDVFDAFRDAKIGKVAHGGPLTVTLPYNDGALYMLLPRNL